MGKRRNQPRGAIRPSAYTGPGGVTYTAEQVAGMLAAQRQQLGAAAPVVPSAAVAKMSGTGVPPGIEASEALQQMTPGSPFAPGTPLPPFDGYSRTPRTRDFPAGVNVATRPRLHERVSFETLRGLIRAYDVAGMCIWHRIDTLRSVKYRLVPADGYSGDVTGAVELAKQVLRKPDGRHHFKNWLARWLYDVLAYDAGALFRLRNRAGRCTGLKTIDGTTLAPLLDYWGDEPGAPAPSHVQIVNGLIWNWLTPDDLIYEPMRPVNDSIYGQPPIELVILNANTDIRTQIHFLQRYTEGNIPEAFASSPESWTPDQIELFQGYWDSFMYGDAARKHQIRWMPGGSSISWTNERDFTDAFSLFMMRKTCAGYHVVPTDLGFTDSSNYSTGESQADVAHKAGELPLMEYTEEILSQFLYDDIRVPVKFEWDRGEDQDDRLVQAQSDQIYIQSAVVDADEIREMRFGLPVDEQRRVGRIFFTERGGPIPLNSFLALAGKIDPETAAPAADAVLPDTAFSDVEGVISNPPVLGTPLAVEEYGPGALPPMPPSQPMPADEPAGADDGDGSKPVAKEGDGAAPATGITAETGLYGYDLDRGDEGEEDGDRERVAKSELAVFCAYRQARRREREWRDFPFTAVGKTAAHNLNDSGRLAVRKDAGEVAVAGLAVLAADTGRVLMLQRALCADDPAAGTWEFPGGHIEGDESPLAAAWREWQEETGTACAPGVQTGSWTSGIYQGIVWTIEREAMVPVRSGTMIPDPDDPDGDQAESIAWWDPATIPGNPAVRPELLAGIGAVTAALGCASPDDSVAAQTGKVAKAADAAPKASGPDGL
jgi:8-oxo-dGTP pyrophosphatase MutT (NUDIX family)